MEVEGKREEGLVLHPGFVETILVAFLRDETRNAGFERGVLGLSGGVDSAVTAFLAARALGPEHVLGVMMPYRLSNPQSLADAQLVADTIGLRTETREITPMVDGYLQTLDGVDQVRAGNVMARQRMIVLYDLSQRDRALVFGTSNKTELLLGYGTLHGDMACAINPLGDLYKTQVWQLARHLGVPSSIIDKRPSADLWEGQTDEGEFGFKYADVDRLLYNMIDQRRTDDELRGAGFDAAFIARIRRLVRVNQFKRRPPIVAKISHRTLNIDFRYARDWGT